MSATTDRLVLSDMTMEVEDFVAQFNEELEKSQTWKGQLVTQTSQTLIEYISTVGTFDQARALRYAEDAFAESAQSDDAIRAITSMQGLRITRKQPAEITVKLRSVGGLTIPPYAQAQVAGINFFNREQIVLAPNTETDVALYQGLVKSIVTTGLSTEFQAFVASEEPFAVSDSDVQVRINQQLLEKSYGVLWNYKGIPAFADLTMPDGRLLIQFGNSRFGAVPQVNDVVVITYAVTDGDASNNSVLENKDLTFDDHADVRGIVQTNPTGGSDSKPIEVYKNVASGSFGTYESAVTKPQYIAQVASYPGIVDAVTQAQREINPNDPHWMNVIRVSALTSSPWTQQQQRDFLDHLQKVSMYSTYFLWVDAVPVDRNIEIEVYFFNTAILSEGKAKAEKAVRELLAPKQGILMTNHYESDIDSAIKKANKGQVSYVKLLSPADGQMVVTSPQSPPVTYSFISGAAQNPMSPGVYAYSVAVTNAEEAGGPSNWVFPQITNAMGDGHAIKLEWPEQVGAVEYRVYGRRGGDPLEPLGLMATIPANSSNATATFLDDGQITPTPPLPSGLSQGPVRYNRIGSLVVRAYYSDRQRRVEGVHE